MKKTILVAGHGPGISDAVARRFGREGFSVAIVARTADRLQKAADSLRAAGVDAKAFPCNLGDAAAVMRLVGEVRGALGPIAVVHWNAYTGGAGDLLKSPVEELHAPYDVAVVGLVAAVRSSIDDLKAQKGSVLVTGGGFAFYDANVDAMAVQWGAMGTAISKAAQHKTVGVLQARLQPEGVYVGEVVVLGTVKGTSFDKGQGTLDAADIAEKFWELHQRRRETTVKFPG